MSRPPHPPWFNHPNNIGWRIQAVKFIIMQFSLRSFYLPFRSKYPPQRSVPPSKSETRFSTHRVQLATYNSVYFHL
jgi:hypothetical protein